MSSRAAASKAVISAAWSALLMQARETLATPAALVVAAIQPFVFIAVASLGNQHLSAARSTQILLGGMMLSMWSSTLWSAGSILRRDLAAGTLAAILARPTPLMVVMVGKTLGASLTSAALIVASGLSAAGWLRLDLSLGPPLYLALIAALSILSAAALGIMVSCTTLLTRAATRVIEALMYPVFVLGGLIVPLSALPGWCRWPAWLVSLHWSVVGASAATRTDRLTVAAALILLTAVYAVGGLLATNTVLDRCRRTASLELA